MTKQNKNISYSIGVVVVLIGFLYVSSFSIHKGALQEAVDKAAVAQGGDVVAENPAGEADPSHMYLGMKTWNWVSAKDAKGVKTTPSSDKFALTFDFNKGSFSATTDCNGLSGVFSAKSGVVLFGDIASTKMYCEGSQEDVFSGYLAQSQRFYFTNKGEMVLTLKDGGTVTFR